MPRASGAWWGTGLFSAIRDGTWPIIFPSCTMFPTPSTTGACRTAGSSAFSLRPARATAWSTSMTTWATGPSRMSSPASAIISGATARSCLSATISSKGSAMTTGSFLWKKKGTHSRSSVFPSMKTAMPSRWDLRPQTIFPEIPTRRSPYRSARRP